MNIHNAFNGSKVSTMTNRNFVKLGVSSTILTMLVMGMAVACGISFFTAPGKGRTTPRVSLAPPAELRPTTVSSSSTPMGDEWPMFRGQLNHAGVVTTTPMQGTGHIWSFNTGDLIWSSPAISGGRVYVGSEDNNLYCLNATTGVLIWNYTTGDDVDSSPAVVGDRVYVGSGDKNVYCFNATTGIRLWNYTTGWGVDSSPAVSGGHVYVGSNDRKLYCLDAITGVLNWSTIVGTQIVGFSSPAVVGGRVYVGSIDCKMHCFNATTGISLWNFTTYNVIDSSPAVVGGFVYFGSQDYTLYCLNAATGAHVWNYTTGWYILCSPAVVNGRVYFGSNDNNTYCLNASTGDSLWEYTTGSYVDSSPVIAGGCVYIGAEDNKTYCLNATTGTFIWSYTMSGLVWNSLAIAGGRVYVGTDNHILYCIPMSLGPTPPQDLHTTPGNTQVLLTWYPPPASYGAKTYGLPVLYYKIYRGTSPGTETYYMTTPNNLTSYTDWGVEPGRGYYYQVSAVSALAEGSRSAEDNGNPFGVPGAPRSLYASAIGIHVSLTWQVPKNNGGLPITNYTIYRGITAGSEEYLVNVSNVTSFTDTSATTGQAYYYTVSAKNEAGEGPQSIASSTGSKGGDNIFGLSTNELIAIGICAFIGVLAIFFTVGLHLRDKKQISKQAREIEALKSGYVDNQKPRKDLPAQRNTTGTSDKNEAKPGKK